MTAAATEALEPAAAHHSEYRHFHVLEENVQLPFRSAFYTREEVANPLIRACILDDFEMIRLLLEYGFIVWDPERVVADDEKEAHLDDPVESREDDLYENEDGEDNEDVEMMSSDRVGNASTPEDDDGQFYPYHPRDPTRWFASYASQRALCSSSYINLTESETVMRCLQLAGRFKRRAEVDVEHAEAYHSLTDVCVSYATGLLDVCRDDDDDDGDGDDPEDAFQEMDAILGISFGGNPARSPQIETAMIDKQMAFYTHEKCYKHIERMWRPFEKPKGSKSIVESLKCLAKLILRPAFLLIFSPLLFFFHEPLSVEEMKFERKNQLISTSTRPPLKRRNAVKKREKLSTIIRRFLSEAKLWMRQLSTPRNSFMNFVCVYAILLTLVLWEIVESTERNMTQFRCPLDSVETFLLLWVIGSALHLMERIVVDGGNFFKDFWNIYAVIKIGVFVAAYAIWFVGFAYYNEGKTYALHFHY